MSTDSPIIAANPAMPPPVKMTYEEFLEWCPESKLAEWVNGEGILLPPPSLRHQDVIAFLCDLLRWFVRTNDLGRVYFAPTQMRLKNSGREPDILFVAKEHQDRFRELYIDGPADLVVEVISPAGRSRDRVEKFREYQEAGVREYWLIDPVREEAEFYSLGEDGVYQRLPIDADSMMHSHVLVGFWFRVEWLWQEPLPLLSTVLKAWDAAQ
jgi:Uma2 family endonuclease